MLGRVRLEVVACREIEMMFHTQQDDGDVVLSASTDWPWSVTRRNGIHACELKSFEQT